MFKTFLIFILSCSYIQAYCQPLGKSTHVILSPSGKPLADVLCMTASTQAVIGFSNKQGKLKTPLTKGSFRFHHINFHDTIHRLANLPDTIYLRAKNENLREVTVTGNLPNPKKHFQNIFKKSAAKFEAHRPDTNYYSHYEKTKINEDSVYFSIPCLAISQLNSSYSNTKINKKLYQPIEVFMSADIETTKINFERKVLAYHLIRTSLIYPKFHGIFFFTSHDVRRIVHDDYLLFVISHSKKEANPQDNWLFKVDKSSGLITLVTHQAFYEKGDSENQLYTFRQTYSTQDSAYALASAYYLKKTVSQGKSVSVIKAEWFPVNCAKYNPQENMGYSLPSSTYVNLLSDSLAIVKKP